MWVDVNSWGRQQRQLDRWVTVRPLSLLQGVLPLIYRHSTTKGDEVKQTSTTRRVFMTQILASVSALTAGQAIAQANKPAAAPAAKPAPAALPLVSETDAQAAGLGYKADTTKVDPKKYPKHAATQNCANCQLYSGKANEPSGPCAIFPGKHVHAKGWCSAWVKKA